MKVLYIMGSRHVEVREVPKPQAERGQAVVKMKVSAICSSDLHSYRRVFGPGQEFVCGHEPCGVIDSLGEGVTHLSVGQRVALYHYQGCGICKFCVSGLMQHCEKRAGFGSVPLPGGDAEFMLINAINATPLPDELSFIDGAFVACIAATTYRSLSKLSLSPQKSLCIFGLGPVGLTAVKIAKAMGAGQIIGIDPNQARRDMAAGIGADAVLDSNEDTVREIKKLTGGGANGSLETSGSMLAQRNAIECATHFGEIAVVGLTGLYDTNGAVNLSRLINNEITIYGSFVISLSQFHDLLDLIRRSKIHFDDLVTHRFPLDKAAEAFELFDKGGTGKVIFEF